ncbi:MAG: hypothetical protein ACYS7Y_33735 [Planctomycetota bacterium]|jgi:hypothetical protein
MIFSGVLIAGAKAAIIKLAAPIIGFFTVNLVPILGFLRKYWREVLIVGLLAGILGTVWWKNRAITALELELSQNNETLAVLDVVLEQNHNALVQCVTINKANAQAYEKALLVAEEAVERARVAEQATEAKVERINEDVKDLRGKDEDCRTLDEPLPDWFDDWLRSDEGSDPVRDH